MNLETKIGNLVFENPLMPASGPFVGDDEKMILLSKLGLGGMVSKTISVKGANVPRPCITSSKNHVVNAELWSEYDHEKWIEEILPRTKAAIKQPLIISVGYTKSDMEVVVPKLDKFADAFEVSTHYVGKDLTVIAETVRTIRSLTDKPFFMKISPHMDDPVAFCRMVLDNGGTGVVAINSVGPTLTIDLQSRSVKVGNVDGNAWMSGPAIKPIALAIIDKIHRGIPECPIIGVGGISTAEDVLEFLLAGASAVQMLSAAMIKGVELYKKIVDDLPKALEKYGFESIEEVVKTELIIPEVQMKPVFPVIDKDKCILCMKCVNSCPYLALRLEDGQIKNDKDKCFGCQLCESVCPKNAIFF